MGEFIDSLLAWMQGLPPLLVYVVIGAFAGLENIFPPVPADVIALFGGFLAGQGVVSPWAAYFIVWGCNAATAMLMYWVGRRYGTGFFQGRIGRMILQPHQMAKLSDFYQQRGTVVIFISRFLPMFRAIVPVFAGTSGIGAVRTAIPIVLASGAWYALIVYLGATAGANLDAVRAFVESSSSWLAAIAGVLGLAVAWWWWRSRRHGQPHGRV